MSDESSKTQDGHVLSDGAGVYIPQEERTDIKVDFGGFAVGLYQSAMVALGEIDHPETGSPTRDLETAKHTIGILEMLQDKTRGNLDEEETQLLKSMLYRARIAFVEAQKQG